MIRTRSAAEVPSLDRFRPNFIKQIDEKKRLSDKEPA